RFEVFPAAGVEDAVAEWLLPGTTVTVTASPAKGLDATLDLTELLAGHGYRVVPHVSARLVADDAHLADIVARLTACGVDDVFDPATMRRWISRVRARGVTLPLYVGLAGPVERARLLRMAAKAGAAESARFLAGHTEWFLRLGTPGGYSPERLLSRLAPTLSSPAAGVEGLHLFTFNQVQQTEQWRRALL